MCRYSSSRRSRSARRWLAVDMSSGLTRCCRQGFLGRLGSDSVDFRSGVVTCSIRGRWICSRAESRPTPHDRPPVDPDGLASPATTSSATSRVPPRLRTSAQIVQLLAAVGIEFRTKAQFRHAPPVASDQPRVSGTMTTFARNRLITIKGVGGVNYLRVRAPPGRGPPTTP